MQINGETKKKTKSDKIKPKNSSLSKSFILFCSLKKNDKNWCLINFTVLLKKKKTNYVQL